MMKTKSLLVSMLLLVVSLSSATAQQAQNLQNQLAYQRGIEAVLWSMPAISDVFFRESLSRDFGMGIGDVMVLSKPLVARHEVLTGNNQVNCAMMKYDLTNGPFVVEIPRGNADYTIIGEICDNWQEPITMVGVEGPDAGNGGKYLLLPPGYTQKVPDGYFPIQMQGFRGTMLFRPVVIGSGTREGAIALAHQTRTYLLADVAAPKPTRVFDARDKSWHSLPVYDVMRWHLLILSSKLFFVRARGSNSFAAFHSAA
jgi:hypothetical protein